MIGMKISYADAVKLLNKILHKRLVKAIPQHWVQCPSNPSMVTVQSICWLYCWGKSGINSVKAAAEAVCAFDKIFDRSFSHVSSRVPHDWAQKIRYEPHTIDYFPQFNQMVP